MREMTNNGLLLCRLQGGLFENYNNYSSCSPFIFIRRFMNSDLAKRFDDTTILLESSSNQTLIEEIDEQYGKTSFGKSKDDNKEMMFWVGYIYRYWSYIYEVSSKQLFSQVQPHLLMDRYELYHSMDPKYVIERICEEEEIYIAPNKTIEEVLEAFLKYHEEK